MDSPFLYNNYVSGNQFIGREKEVNQVKNLILSKRNILIYGPPKTGKKSIIFNALNSVKESKHNYILCRINMFNIRCIEAMMLKYTNEILKCFSNSSVEWCNLLNEYIPTAPYAIDESANEHPKLTYTNKALLTNEQIENILNLPEALAKNHNIHLIIYFEQFHDILLFDDPFRVFILLERVWKGFIFTSFILTGERLNAMDEIFKEKKYLYKFSERVNIPPISEKVFADFIIKGFLKGGKVAPLELAQEIYRIVEGDSWYTQHLSALAYHLTQGYLTKSIVEDATKQLIHLYSYQFHSIAYGLSKNQLRFIKAVLEGVTRFSSADILDKYKLNSSANVNRIKEALAKKEILTFNSKTEAVFIDPLLKLWFINNFFVK